MQPTHSAPSHQEPRATVYKAPAAVCPRCARSYVGRATFCPYCGAAYAGTADAPPGLRHCPHCDGACSVSHSACPACGFDFTTGALGVPAAELLAGPPDTRQTMEALRIVAMVVSVACGLVSLFLLLRAVLSTTP